ncbi:hypothetical protein F4859DRAFT_485436 [Xylaria cf. heliscus]|nr:hypothetical protein F4859DRAFT_485436 [Xylaria cf. heliscus]
MDHLIKSFIQVHRQLDDTKKLCGSFSNLEAPALIDPSSILDVNKRRILDLLEPETQAANIAADYNRRILQKDGIYCYDMAASPGISCIETESKIYT